jgi:uncharacterized protein
MVDTIGRNARMATAASGSPTIDLLILQPTPFCNIDCRYCYLSSRSSRKRMSWATLERTMECVFDSPFVDRQLSVVWHAGEPLVLPVAYYEEAFERIARMTPLGLEVDHNIQTNGLLIDDHWIDLFERSGVRVGLSIDGPRHLHDANRVTRRGAGTHDDVMRAVARLNERSFDFHVITVLTVASLDAPDALYEFYTAAGIRRVGFNIEEIEGANARSSLDVPETPERLRRFLERFLELTHLNPGGLFVREFEGAVGAILHGHEARFGNSQTEPLRILSVDVDGNLSTFSPELLGVDHPRYGEFAFGNVHGTTLEAVLGDRRLQEIRAAIDQGVEQCRATCDYFEVCRGGAPANKLFETGRLDSTETLYCRLNKQVVIDVVLADLERQLHMTERGLAAENGATMASNRRDRK